MKKQLSTAVFLAVLFLLSTISSSYTDVELSVAHTTVKNSCSTTLYPDLCYSTLADSKLIRHVKSHKNVIELTLNVTISTIKSNRFIIQKVLNTKKNLTKREITALGDCLSTLDDSLDDLHDALKDVEHYPNTTKKNYEDDLKTLMSSAMTNQETCLEGFSFDDYDKKVRESFLKEEVHVKKLCSNSLAMVVNMTVPRKKLKAAEEENIGGWPKWLSSDDKRKLFEENAVTPDVVVAADGSGKYKTVMEAVAAAPDKSSKRYVIKIKGGVYKENVEVSKKKTNIMLIGDGKGKTIITGSRNVDDGSTTFRSATVAVMGTRFLARDITFQNTAGPSKYQAVALRVGSDLSAFYRCDIVAYQDTLYLYANRQFFYDCFISGTVDFIFGNAAAVIQNSVIHARKPNSGQKNMVTAQSRTDPNQNTGFVLQKCTIGAALDLIPAQNIFPTYLGRPWKEYSRVVVMQSTITDVIDPAGWHEWNGKFGLDTLFYGEYKNTGAGAGTSKRVKWKGVKVIMNDAEAQSFTAGSFIDGDSWLSSTGFPFSLSL